jgi:hypothetical protein
VSGLVAGAAVESRTFSVRICSPPECWWIPGQADDRLKCEQAMFWRKGLSRCWCDGLTTNVTGRPLAEVDKTQTAQVEECGASGAGRCAAWGGSVAHPLCRSARTAACESTCQRCERWVLESMSLNPDPVIETWQKLAKM